MEFLLLTIMVLVTYFFYKEQTRNKKDIYRYIRHIQNQNEKLAQTVYLECRKHSEERLDELKKATGEMISYLDSEKTTYGEVLDVEEKMNKKIDKIMDRLIASSAKRKGRS